VIITTNAQKIKMALAFKSMKEAELARSLGTTPQAFNQRLKSDKFSTDDLCRIATVFGAAYESAFVFPDGTKI
jgi:transcriptional regulator with XRE-family HTH domain